jgi:hypothetical protein
MHIYWTTEVRNHVAPYLMKYDYQDISYSVLTG